MFPQAKRIPLDRVRPWRTPPRRLPRRPFVPLGVSYPPAPTIHAVPGRCVCYQRTPRTLPGRRGRTGGNAVRGRPAGRTGTGRVAPARGGWRRYAAGGRGGRIQAPGSHHAGTHRAREGAGRRSHRAGRAPAVGRRAPAGGRGERSGRGPPRPEAGRRTGRRAGPTGPPIGTAAERRHRSPILRTPTGRTDDSAPPGNHSGERLTVSRASSRTPRGCRPAPGRGR